MKVRRITKEEGKRVNISRFPNFHKSGSIRGMKKQYYGVAALLVRCGSYIYNTSIVSLNKDGSFPKHVWKCNLHNINE